MSNVDIVRAWKDENYRSSLSEEQRALLPENPAGAIELTDMDLEQVEGAGTTLPVGTVGCCQTYWTCDFWKCLSTLTAAYADTTCIIG